MNMTRNMRTYVKATLIIVWLLALGAVVLSAAPQKEEPMFHIPGILTQAERDRQIRWYSSAEAPQLRTANRERFNDQGFTFASHSLPFGTRVRIDYNGKHAVFRCNDRGPNLVELTLGGFRFLEDPAVGVLLNAKITILND